MPRRPFELDPLLGIALFKLAKACLLLAAGVSALALRHQAQPLSTLQNLARELRVDPDNRVIHGAIAAVSTLDARQLAELSLGTFVYATVFLIEGVGLWRRKRWAEYLTTGVTASLVPFEIYELLHHPSALKAVGIAVNLLIVGWLFRRLQRARQD